MLVILIFILGNLLHCACSDYTADKCVANDTSHRNCLVTENNTCDTKCINPDLYEATGDNKKCIVKACASYDEKTCYLNDACVLTEQNPPKCASSCIDYKVFLPVQGRCVESGCRDRSPKSMSVFIKINRVKFNYGYKTNNNVGVTVMGIQKNTSFYSGSSNQSDFNYTNETGLTWDNVPEVSLERVRIQVYTDKQYFIGQAYLNISEYKTPGGIKTNITVESGDITIPIQNQTVYLEVGVCTSCASADWPCGDPKESQLCYQDLNNCSLTCTETDNAHYNPDLKTGICERVCEERLKTNEDTWPCGKDYETVACYLNTGGGLGDSECAQTCSKEGWYAVKPGGDRCELKECIAREADLTVTHPCGSADECLYDPSPPTNGPVCVASCPQDDAHTGEVDNGKCVLACTLRQPNMTATHPCGQQCLFDPSPPANGKQCVEECPFDEDHTGEVDSGRCIVGTNCDARVANTTAPFPCGAAQDCLFDPLAPEDGPRCVSSCVKDDSHTGEIEQGACELVCELWDADLTSIYPCGIAQDCLYVPQAPIGGPPCVETCPKDEKHTGAVNDGWCVLACVARKANLTAARPCGDDCEYDPEAPIDGPRCVDSCPKDEKHTGATSQDGQCLLTCAYRKVDLAATYPCGHNQDCILDKEQCVEKCPVDDEHTGEVFSGRCELGLNCPARKADITAGYPCGSKLDCQLITLSSGPQCVEDCPVDETYSGSAEGGVCSLVCPLRKADPTAIYPCGPLDCFLDQAVEEGGEQCVAACPVDDTHTGEVDDGTCVLDLTDRQTKKNVSWWDEKILGLARKWFIAIVGGGALLILIIIIVIIVAVRKKKKDQEGGYVAINSDD